MRGPVVSSRAALLRLSSRPAPVGAIGLVLAALALLAYAGPASAGERTWRVGVVEGVVNPQADVARMGTANVGAFRTLFSWKRIEQDGVRPGTCPGPLSYDWRYYDELVLRTSARDVPLLPVIVGSPAYVSADSRNAPDTSEPEIRNYKCFVRELVQRYGPGGELPSASGARPIREWQVWNEPNLHQYNVNGGRVRPRQYGKLLEVTREQIKSVDPGALIVMAGMPEQPSRGMRNGQFLEKLYRTRGIERKFDVAALHPYAVNARGVEGAVIRLRRVLRRLGDRGRYVWITEVGWGTHGRTGQHSFLEKSESGQARELKKTFRMLRNNRRRYKLGTVTWLRWRDTEPYSKNRDPFNYAGLFRKDGTVKPSCHAFVQFTGGGCRRIDGASAAALTTAAGSSLLEPQPTADEPVPSPPE